MKKLFVTMTALLMMSASAVYADGGTLHKTAMLEQGDSIQLFYGFDAFKQAYNAAADSGAVITLSKGNFGTFEGVNKKSMKIIGYYGFSSDATKATVFDKVTIHGKDVTFDGIYFRWIGIPAVEDLTLIHSTIDIFWSNGDTYHTNTTIDQCVVDRIETSVFDCGKNFCIKNSKLSSLDDFYGRTEKNAYAAYILNCIILAKDVLEEWDLPYAVYENNIFYQSYSGNTAAYLSYPSTYSHNSFYGYYLNWGENDRHEGNVQYDTRDVKTSYPFSITPDLGSDGTSRGPLGGTGFKETASVPRITDRKIDLRPDSIGHINVKISVSAE